MIERDEKNQALERGKRWGEKKEAIEKYTRYTIETVDIKVEKERKDQNEDGKNTMIEREKCRDFALICAAI